MDNRSKKFVFVPFCMMAQAFQAQGIVKYEHKASIKPIMQLLIDEDINIVQMGCAEASYKDSLIREPKGINKYNTDEFNKHCDELANRTYEEIERIINGGYEVIAILGIENSPTCCVNYIYTDKGMQNRKGLFMEKLYQRIEKYEIPIIGINRKYVNKGLKELKECIDKSKKNK